MQRRMVIWEKSQQKQTNPNKSTAHKGQSAAHTCYNPKLNNCKAAKSCSFSPMSQTHLTYTRMYTEWRVNLQDVLYNVFREEFSLLLSPTETWTVHPFRWQRLWLRKAVSEKGKYIRTSGKLRGREAGNWEFPGSLRWMLLQWCMIKRHGERGRGCRGHSAVSKWSSITSGSAFSFSCQQVMEPHP